MKQLIIISILCVLSIAFIQAQTFSVKGTVVDKNANPVEAAACVLQGDEQTAVYALITDSLGRFSFSAIDKGHYKLIVQHLSYDRDTIDVNLYQNKELPSIILYSNGVELSGIEVKGERPLVKNTEGGLVYNAPLLMQNKIVDNAFEALKIVPNIVGGDDNLTLIGADDYAIAINGQVSGMNKSQIVTLLKNTPASKVKDIEVMYSAPPQFNVRGAVVNVILDTPKTEIASFQGELNTFYRQATYGSYSTRVNLTWNSPTYSLDLSLGGLSRKSKNKMEMHAIHLLDEDTYDIIQRNNGKPKGTDLDSRFVFDYKFPNKDKIVFAYTREYNSYKSLLASDAIYKKNGSDFEEINSFNNTEGKDRLHNFRIDYASHKKLTIGVEHVFYKDPGTQNYKDYREELLSNEYSTKTMQQVNKTTFSVGHQFSAGKGWSLNYGANASLSKTENDYAHYPSADSDADSLRLSEQQEINLSSYIGFSKSLNKKLSIQASLSGNYFKATIDQSFDQKKTLWDKFEPFVNANLNYSISDKHSLQYSFSTDVEYPPYWALNPDAVQLNAYSIVRGNPELKFSKSYASQLVYIFKKKYMLVGSYKYDSDYFTQLPYQSDDELKNIFQVENLDYRKTASLSAIVPVRISTLLDSKTTLSYIYTKEKDSDFLREPYLKSKNSIVANFRGTINVSSKPNIKMDISAFYMNGHIQGVYNIHHMSSVDAGLKWVFCNDKAELSAKITDIFQGMNARTSVNIDNQRSTMTNYSDSPSFRIAFVYKFGGYKAKSVTEVDKSRLGRSN